MRSLIEKVASLLEASIPVPKVGDVIRYGSTYGPKTLAQVVGVSGKSLKVKTLEPSGRNNQKKAGSVVRIPKTKVLSIEEPGAAKAASKKRASARRSSKRATSAKPSRRSKDEDQIPAKYDVELPGLKVVRSYVKGNNYIKEGWYTYEGKKYYLVVNIGKDGYGELVVKTSPSGKTIDIPVFIDFSKRGGKYHKISVIHFEFSRGGEDPGEHPIKGGLKRAVGLVVGDISPYTLKRKRRNRR